MTLSYHSGIKKWLYFDDEDYGIIEDEKEVGSGHQVVSENAYFLFYVRKDLKTFSRQSLKLPENWPFKSSGSLSNFKTSKKNTLFRIPEENDRSLMSRRQSRSKKFGELSSRHNSQISEL